MATISAALPISLLPPAARRAVSTATSSSPRVKVRRTPSALPSAVAAPSDSVVPAESRADQVLRRASFPGAAGDLRTSTPSAGAAFIPVGRLHERLDRGRRGAGAPGDRLPQLPQAHGLRGLLPRRRGRLRRRARQRLLGRLR